MRNGFLAEFFHPRTVILSLVALMFEFGNLHQYGKSVQVNMWDVILPSISHSHFVVLFGLLWWLFVLHGNISTLYSSTELIRLGSKVKAFRYTIVQSAKKYLIACFAIFLITIPMAISCGLSLDFSERSLQLGAIDQSLDVFASSSWAKFISSPLLALTANVLFTFLSFICLAALHSALVLQNLDKFANYIVTCIYLVAAASSFGGIANTLAVDPVSLFDLAWAFHTGSIFAVSCIWAVVFALAVFRVYLHTSVLLLVENLQRWTTLVIVGSVSALIAVGSAHGSFARSWALNFQGKDHTLFGYARISMLILIVAAAGVSSFKENVEFDLSHVHLRYGTRRGWFIRQVKTSFVVCCSGVATIISVSLVSFAVLGSPPIVTDWLQIASTSSGILLTTCIYVFLGSFVYIITESSEAWLGAFCFGLSLGYLPQILPGEFNIFALYSTSLTSSVNTFLQSSACGLFVLLVLCFLVAAKALLLNSSKLTTIES